MTSPPDSSPDITGALALLREALRAPVPPKPIIEFALDACAAAGFPPTTPELDDKLRALGLLFGVAAPTPAHLTHFLWHILDGNIPLAITRQAMESLDKLEFKGEFKGLAGEQTRKVLEVIGADLGAVYGDSLVKNLAVIVRAVARKAVEMTTAEWEEACHVARAEKIEAVKALAAAGGSNLEGELAAVRSEAAGLRQTQALLEADLTLICEASGLTTAKDVAGCIKDQYEALALIRQAYNAALGRGPSVGATAEEVAEHITALTGSDKALAWFQDLWGRTAYPSNLLPGCALQARRFVLLGQTAYESALQELETARTYRQDSERWHAFCAASKLPVDKDLPVDFAKWTIRMPGKDLEEIESLRVALRHAENSRDGRVLRVEHDREVAELRREVEALRAGSANKDRAEPLTAAEMLAPPTGPETIRLAAAPAYTRRWLRVCELADWNPEHEPQKPDGPDKLIAFIEKSQAVLVKPLRDELRSRQAPNLAAFGYEKAEPARIVELAAERIQVDAREIGRLRAANRDLTAKIESAPGSGLRKRLKEAERIAGNPGEIWARKVELEKIQQQTKEAKAQRDAVLVAARKDPTGASIIKDMQAELEQYRSDCVAAEHAHDDIKGKYQTLAAAVCPFPKEHDKLVKQAAAARDRALIECSAALPDGYRLEHATPDGGPCGYRWTTRVDTWGVTARGPGVAVRQAWQRLVGQQQTAHREAVRHAEKRLAELDGPVPIRSVLLAALEALGWTAAAGDPEDWAIREGAKLATDRKALSDLRSIMADAEKREAVLVKERATLIGDLQDIALEVDPSLGGEALLERIRQIVHDAAACEQHRRQVDAIDADLGRVIGERGEGLTLESRLAELVEQRDMYRKAAEPVLSSDGPQPGPDPHGMQRIRDLLHERRVRLAVRDGEACSWPELVRGLVDDFYTAEGDEKFLRRRIEEAEQRAAANAAKVEHLEAQLAGKGSAADHVREGWETGAPPLRVAADGTVRARWDGSAWKVIEGAAWQVGLAIGDPGPWESFVRDIVKLTGARYHPGHVGVMLDAITRWHAVAHAK
jgi:hypothetical protein